MPEENPNEVSEETTVINIDEDEESISFRYSITSYGADYPVDSLVKRLQSNAIIIPEFQRGYVWTVRQASRFIESLLLGLPVPGIFLSKEPESQRLLVIDGQQRLKSLRDYYDGIFEKTGRAFVLEGVQQDLEGRSYKALEEDDRLRLDDAILHATVIRQDEPSEDQSSIYHVFERLNTGGTLLNPQEIRASIYHGPFNDLLTSMNRNAAWRSIFGPTNKRMRDQELILRYLALRFELPRYKRPMKEFLNIFMAKNKSFDHYAAEEIRLSFVSPIELIAQSIGPVAFKPKGAINAAVFDSIMYGLSMRLANGPIQHPAQICQVYQQLLGDVTYLGAVEKATADEESVKKRLRISQDAFAEVI